LKVSTQAGESSVTFLLSSTSWQLLPSAKFSKLCAVKASLGTVAMVIPARSLVFSFCAACRILSNVSGAGRPAASKRSLR
jgi:hypothetical protein